MRCPVQRPWCSLWEWLIWSFPPQFDEDMWGHYVQEDEWQP